MGEVVLSCEELREKEEKKGNKESSSSMVKWERFLPRVSIRVLLVEADDSTRQIISALLRKCSYKVASVSDGLKAWEVLKARPHNIDLILTEVELPSISGYALLTLIMEHEICKNIPVIMMSTHDSVSTVYKCMLRGAADFLVKPIRTNELKNLWQHVWRRQSMSRPGVGPQDESVAQEKLEATAENNATSDRSSSSKSYSPRQDNCIKKGSDAQSSCGKPDLKADSDCMAEVENHSLPKQTKSLVSGLNIPERSNYEKSDQNLRGLEIAVAESHTATANENNVPVQDGRLEQQSRGENVIPCTEGSNNRDFIDNPSNKAIDLIGALRDHLRPNSCMNDVANNFESSPDLDLSLMRFNSNIREHKTTYEKQMLNHSNASAFTRYVNKAICSSDANANSVSTPKGPRVNAGDNLSDNSPGSNTNPMNFSLLHDGKVISLPTNLAKEAENEYPTASQRLLPIQFQARGIRVDVCSTPAGYRSTIPPVVRTPSPSHSPSSTNQRQNSFPQLSVDVINGRHHYHHFDQSPRISSNQSINKQDQNLESLGDRTQLSPATDQSASSTLCNETAGNLNVFSCAGNVQQDALVPGSSNSGNQQAHPNNLELNRQRSIQREAALTKFRLKRKERCFEKKVRYESRKKLAEQRPRVKGQFVRQVPPDPPPQ